MPSTPARRALIVEDDPAIRELLRLHLELAGFTLDETVDGRQALDLAKTTTFDLNDRTVDTVISRLRRKLERDPHHPEMLLTAWGVGDKFADRDEKRLSRRCTCVDMPDFTRPA